MATGGNLSRTLEGGHEPFYDFSCSLCEKEKRHVEAAKFCEECLVYLCDHCLRDKHNMFPLNERHQLLDQSQFAAVNKPALVSFPTKRCPNHPGELINIFCGNHDVVCCSVCKALEHSNCAKTQHLPDAATGVQKSRECQSIKKGTRALISDLDKVCNDRKADISRIAKEMQHVKQTIAHFRKKVNKYFDDLQENTLAELDQRQTSIVRSIDQDKKYLETTKSKAEDILKRVESFKGDNESDLFVQVKTGLQFLNDAVEKLRDLSQRPVKPSIHFEVNGSIEEYLTSLKSLGSFSSTQVDITQPQIAAVPQVTSPRPLVLPTRKQPYHEVRHFPYETQNSRKFNVQEKSDTDTCDIYSIYQFPDDTFLITDFANAKLKRLDRSLNLLDSVQLSDSPHSVCATGHGQVAVTVYGEKKIQFVSVGKKLTLTRSFTVGDYCNGIVYIGNELFVCCGDHGPSSGCIEVYNNAGQLQRTIARAPQCLPLVPEYITVTDDGQYLLVTCDDSDVITMLDLTGNVVNTFSHKDLKDLSGMCTDGRGQVFVCGLNSHTVVQLSPKQQKIEVILTEAGGIKEPEGICYDKRKSRLLVSLQNSNELLVFTLK